MTERRAASKFTANRLTMRKSLNSLGMIGVAIVFASPFYLLVNVSLKTTLGAYENPFTPSAPNWNSYSQALSGAGLGVNLGGALANSILLTMGSCLILVCLGSLAAYAMARNPGRMSNVLFVFFVLGIIIPSQLGIVPFYTAVRDLGLVGTIPGMMLDYVCKQMPLTVFLYVSFFRQFPRSFEEAAAVDGARLPTIFLRVIMPQMKAVTGTAILLNALYIWNDLFDQLVFLSGSKSATLPVAIYSLTFSNLSQWNIVFAAVVISILPMVVLFLILQKRMISNLAGGLKG